MLNFITRSVASVLILFVICFTAFAQSLPPARPGDVQMSAENLSRIDNLVDQAIANNKMPGAVVLVGRKGKIIFRKAYGNRMLVPTAEAMSVDTIFDLASLTKPIATATSIMILVEQGKIRLDDTISKFIPEIVDDNAKQVTIQQLLTHTSGYRGGFGLNDKWETADANKPKSKDIDLSSLQSMRDGRFGMLQLLKKEKLRKPAGTEFNYSDIGFIVLGEIIERVSRASLLEFFCSEIREKLGMKSSGFRYRNYSLDGIDCESVLIDNYYKIAPTQKVKGQRNYLGLNSYENKVKKINILRGRVHDPTASRMEGISGNAGLFSTADDLARFCQMILNGGILDGKRILSAESIHKMTKPYVVSETGDTRGLGWDINTKFSSNRGELFPLGSFGHTGWTGTGIWIDPLSKTFVIFLSNRVHPDGKGNIVDVRAKISTVVAAAITDAKPKKISDLETKYHKQIKIETEQLKINIANGNIKNVLPTNTPRKSILQLLRETSQLPVYNGVDVLQEDNFKRLGGLKIGLVTNHTGKSFKGRSTIDIFHESKNIQLVSLFSPEHGIRGELDQEKINDSVDERTGLKINSLYGKSRRPKTTQLENLDAIVFDIQDIGTRFYTYISTLRFILEEAAKADKKVFVLDRPNPINGIDVAGAIADEEKLSFVAPHTLPIRHGMTIGEIALMMNDERKISADLEVVEMKNWLRSMWFDETNQIWINPSPNMRNLTQATLYPGIGLLETTNLSVGRGTDTPFEIIGSPWIDGQNLATYLKGKKIKGVRFVPVNFMPKSSVFNNEKCSGINIIITNRDEFEPIKTGLEIALALRTLYPNVWEMKNYNRLLADQETFELVQNKSLLPNIINTWKSPLETFMTRRSKYLLY